MRGHHNASGLDRRHLFLDVDFGDDCKDGCLALVQGKSIKQIDFIILDELGYLPFAQAGANCYSV